MIIFRVVCVSEKGQVAVVFPSDLLILSEISLDFFFHFIIKAVTLTQNYSFNE